MSSHQHRSYFLLSSNVLSCFHQTIIPCFHGTTINMDITLAIYYVTSHALLKLVYSLNSISWDSLLLVLIKRHCFVVPNLNQSCTVFSPFVFPLLNILLGTLSASYFRFWIITSIVPTSYHSCEVICYPGTSLATVPGHFTQLLAVVLD